MIDIILFEDHAVDDLSPLTSWRTIMELRLARLTMLERTARMAPSPITGVWTRPEMADVTAHRLKLPVNQPINKPTLLINARWIITESIVIDAIPQTAVRNQTLVHHLHRDRNDQPPTPPQLLDESATATWLTKKHAATSTEMLIQYPWDLIRCLSNRLVIDCAEPCSRDLDDKSIHPCAHLEGDQSIHIAPTARIGPSTVLDATAGPILIDDNTVVSPHVLIEGPAYIGPYSRINPHAHLHGGVAIGPHCKVGGEIDACIFHSYSNKQHAGFLGHAYVGSWVNLGAGTTNSDLKNTYGPIRASHRGTECDTGMQFFGATIADHVKTGINQSIPTGASFEFAAMIATSSMAPKHIPPASWLTPNSQTTGDPDRLLATAKKMAARRNVNFSPDEETLFKLRCRQA